jgi:predicted nucleic acid-binding protein
MADSVLVDSSVLVSSFSPTNPNYTVARLALAAMANSGTRVFVAAHSLVETYSVLTRLPAGSRLTPEDALSLINAFADAATMLALTSEQIAQAITAFAATGIAGGAVYDALIIETAIQAGVDEILTFNVRDFERLARARITVTRPALQ